MGTDFGKTNHKNIELNLLYLWTKSKVLIVK